MVESAPSFQHWCCNNKERFLIHVCCKGTNGASNSLTVSYLPGWGINSLSMDGNKAIFSTGRITKRTVKCFLEEYLAQVKSQVEGKRLSKSKS